MSGYQLLSELNKLGKEDLGKPVYIKFEIETSDLYIQGVSELTDASMDCVAMQLRVYDVLQATVKTNFNIDNW